MLEVISRGMSGEYLRRNSWTKPPKELPLETSEKFLEKIPEVILEGNPRRNFWEKMNSGANSGRIHWRNPQINSWSQLPGRTHLYLNNTYVQCTIIF